MTHGALIAVHAAAAAKAKAKVIDAFRIHGATAPERARPLADLGIADADRWPREFVEAGVLRGVDRRGRPAVLGDQLSGAEAWYLDEVAFIAYRDGRTPTGRKRAILSVLAVVLGILLAFLGVALLRTGGG